MTEPVAYLVSQEPLSSVRWVSKDKPIGVDDKQITPLYTENQLRVRVKMTQAEFDEFQMLYKSIKSSTIIGLLNTIRTNEHKNFGLLKLRLNKSGKDIEIVNLWANYDPERPEETIEILPDMKWFVRSKEKNGDKYLYLKNDEEGFVTPWYTVYKDNARQFDTEDEANLWNNPLTEAVQLPVEDK